MSHSTKERIESLPLNPRERLHYVYITIASSRRPPSWAHRSARREECKKRKKKKEVSGTKSKKKDEKQKRQNLDNRWLTYSLPRILIIKYLTSPERIPLG